MKVLFFIVCAVLYQCSTAITLCPICGITYWPSDCPSVEAVGNNPNVCQNPQSYNDTIQEQLCLTPTCIEPLVDCYRSNCSEQTAFLKDVLCGRNNEGSLCLNLFAEQVMNGSIMCNSCPLPNTCTATCKMMVLSIIDKLGCCAALLLNNTNPSFTLVQTAALNDCNVTIGEKCTGLGESTSVTHSPSPPLFPPSSSPSPLTSLTSTYTPSPFPLTSLTSTHPPSPSPSPLTSLTSTHPPSPIGTPSPTSSGSTFKANVVVFMTTFVVLLAILG